MIGTMYLEVTQLNLGSIHSIQSRNFNSLSHVNTKEIPRLQYAGPTSKGAPFTIALRHSKGN